MRESAGEASSGLLQKHSQETGVVRGAVGKAGIGAPTVAAVKYRR
jgi:hypothetical protein